MQSATTIKLTPCSAVNAVKEQYPDVISCSASVTSTRCSATMPSRRRVSWTLSSPPAATATAKMPMCGVPTRGRQVRCPAHQPWVRVAICDQMEDPKLAKGIVKRGFRVVTPEPSSKMGCWTPRATTTGRHCAFSGGCGVAVVDVSTGEFAVCEVRGDGGLTHAMEEIARLAPAECLLREVDEDLTEKVRQTQRHGHQILTDASTGSLRGRAAVALRYNFAQGFGCEDYTRGLRRRR